MDYKYWWFLIIFWILVKEYRNSYTQDLYARYFRILVKKSKLIEKSTKAQNAYAFTHILLLSTLYPPIYSIKVRWFYVYPQWYMCESTFVFIKKKFTTLQIVFLHKHSIMNRITRSILKWNCKICTTVWMLS